MSNNNKNKVAVALFVYRRPDCLVQVLEGLKKNKFEDIFIFQDKYIKEKDKEKWKEVSKIINQFGNKENVEIHISKKHRGLAESIYHGMDYVFSKFDQAIILEDDMVLLPGYKDFIETCFKKYEHQEEVLCISGSSIGTIIPTNYKYDVFFCHRMCSAAFGTWAKNWKLFRKGYSKNPFALKKIYENERKLEWLNRAGDDIETMVSYSIKGKIDTWATYWALYQADSMGWQVIPCKALAVDIGREGDGTNTQSKMTRFEGEIWKNVPNGFILPNSIIYDEEIANDNLAVANFISDAKRFGFYYSLFFEWIKLLQDKEEIVSFFKKRKWKQVYIYGTSKAAEAIFKEIYIYSEVISFLVEYKDKEKFMEVPVIELGETKLQNNIPIIITPMHDIKYLNHLFKRHKITNPFIGIDEIIEAYCKK